MILFDPWSSLSLSLSFFISLEGHPAYLEGQNLEVGEARGHGQHLATMIMGVQVALALYPKE
jgi:hypothetical protein